MLYTDQMWARYTWSLLLADNHFVFEIVLEVLWAKVVKLVRERLTDHHQSTERTVRAV